LRCRTIEVSSANFHSPSIRIVRPCHPRTVVDRSGPRRRRRAYGRRRPGCPGAVGQLARRCRWKKPRVSFNDAGALSGAASAPTSDATLQVEQIRVPSTIRVSATRSHRSHLRPM